MPRRKLTAKSVETLRSRDGEQVDVWDLLTPGLCLRVGQTRKTWYVRYRANGKHRRMKLGTADRLSLADARTAARNALAAADAGADPAAETVEPAALDRSFRALADDALNARAAKTRARTQQERRRFVDRELLPLWGDREASSIARREVVELVERIAARAPVQANRGLSIIRLIFNTGIRRGFPGLELNPAHLIEPPAPETNGRDRFLSAAEIKKLWTATEHEPLWIRGVVRLVFLTASRVGSVLAMKWADVDGETWTIPEPDFKGRRPHLVPLSDEAGAVLVALRTPAPADDVFVFPSRDGTAAGHVVNFGKPMSRVRKLANIPHFTLHDARRTFRTHATRAVAAGGLGVAPNVADAVLGHKEESLGYNRYTGDRINYLATEKRDALTKWGLFVAQAVAG